MLVVGEGGDTGTFVPFNYKFKFSSSSGAVPRYVNFILYNIKLRKDMRGRSKPK